MVSAKVVTLVDFGILYHKCSVSELLKKLQNSFSFHLQTTTFQPLQTFTNESEDSLESRMKIVATKPLTHPSLYRYLRERKVPFQIANRYCKEVVFEVHQKRYFAIGFQIIPVDLSFETGTSKAAVLQKT